MVFEEFIAKEVKEEEEEEGTDEKTDEEDEEKEREEEGEGSNVSSVEEKWKLQHTDEGKAEPVEKLGKTASRCCTFLACCDSGAHCAYMYKYSKLDLLVHVLTILHNLSILILLWKMLSQVVASPFSIYTCRDRSSLKFLAFESLRLLPVA